MRNSKDLCAPWSARGKSKQQPDWIICPLACGKRKKSKTGLLRRQSSTLLENWEESNSSICQTKNSKRPLTTTSDALQDGDKKALWGAIDEIVASGELHKETKCACIVEAHESTKVRLKSILPKNHDDHMEEKSSIQWFTTIWCINLFESSKLQ